MSRREPPNAPYRQGLQDETTVRSRTHTAQVTSVDTRNGRVSIQPVSMSEEYSPQIPLYGLDIRGARSSWMRYMPQANSFVKLSYGPNYSPECIGYSAFGDEPRQPGLPRQGAYASIQNFADDDPSGFGTIWRQLGEGEFDARSAGGAEIVGSRGGTLSLAGGGGVTLRLIKRESELRTRAGLTELANDGTTLRLGAVKRTAAGVSLPITPNPAALGVDAAREATLTVDYTPTPGAPALTYVSFAHGTVTLATGAPAVGVPTALTAAAALVPFPALPLRSSMTWYGATGLLPALDVAVDQLGNVQVAQQPTAPAGFTVTGTRMFLHGQTNATLAATGFTYLGSEGALLSRSAVPGAAGVSQSFVLGTVWAAAEASRSAALTAACTTLLAALPAASLTSAGLGAALATFAGAVSAALSAFSAAGAPTGFLSTSVFGE